MTRRLFSFMAVVSFFLSCTEIPDALREGAPADLHEEAEDKCSGRAYTEYQFCAGGKIYDFCGGTPYNPTVVACCNNHQYTLATEFCSGLYVYPRCGGKEYDIDTQFCGSGGDVLNKCGGSSYDPASYFCYGDRRYELCGGSKLSYNPEVQACSNGIVQGKCGNGYYNPAIQFCSSTDSKVYSLCGEKEYNPSSQQCQSEVVETKCGNGWYNSDAQFCSGSSVYDLCGGKTYDPSSQQCQVDVVENKYGFLEYEGQVYKTVVIGTQTWMAENLNYNASGSECYNDGIDNCEKYGRLYNWSVAKTVCPIGWHLPSSAEWDILMTKVGGSSTAGTKLKATSGWNDYNGKSGNGTDDYGFAALPGGGARRRVPDPNDAPDACGDTCIPKSTGYWWSDSESDGNYASCRYMFSGNEGVSKIDYYKLSSFSVRCVKD